MNLNPDENSSVPLNLEDESHGAVNSLILDYYKKIGRKRNLEQFFSLSTEQSEIRDPTSLFWARMKTENESSDSGERSDKKSSSSQEIRRISIRFPGQDPCTSQEEDTKTKTESVSPPIIIEELPQDSGQNSEDDGDKSDDAKSAGDDAKSDDNHSQKSYDVLIDTSMKLHSPSSSITSQRKLEWDSLADVGYANESDRKTSASSLSTLERLALKQQISNNDTQQNSNLGIPTAHSTPLDAIEGKSKLKKGVGKKSTKIYKKDVDMVEVNVPSSNLLAQSINVNLTKHISFNVEKDGKVTIDNVQKDISVSPDKVALNAEITSKVLMERDVQTSLEKGLNKTEEQEQQQIPIVISLNTLKSRVRRRRMRMARRKVRSKKRNNKENIPVQEKSGEQLSEAESFEYMPGHIYNQNQMTANVPDNKSSLESSGILTSDSSKGSKHSFTKDLEKSIDLLKAALQKRSDDGTLKKQLIQQVCQRLLNSQYRDDESTTDFLSGLSFGSKKLGLREPNNTTTSSSANSTENSKKPKKSILRPDKFNAGSIASTSQSVPNLPIASTSEKPITSNLTKNLSSQTESDVSSKDKTSSDNGFTKTSSQELYLKYLQALKQEEAYKKHLKDKEIFLKQKLVCSDSALKVPVKAESKPTTNRFKDLINDLTKNNFDNGSGDAGKLEGGLSHTDCDRIANRNQRSHSVFTVSSGHSDSSKKPNLKKRLQSEFKDLCKPGTSKGTHYCCCPHHNNLKFTDSSIQVNIKKPCDLESCPLMQNKSEKVKESPRKLAKIIAEDNTGNLEYVCLCSKKVIQDAPEDFLIYKCSRLTSKGVQLEETSSKSSTEALVQCNDDSCPKRYLETQYAHNKSSQTDVLIKMTNQGNVTLVAGQKQSDIRPAKSVNIIYEATRCIQTEISIDPRIAEPTLSDIKIISDIDCARLIGEHCREVSKSTLTDALSTQAVASSSTAVSSIKSTRSSKDMGIDLQNYELPPKINEKNDIPVSTSIEGKEKFTLPIQGTNVTLMVTLGSENIVSQTKVKDMVTQSIGTEKVSAIEQATSITEECSKVVQADEIVDDEETIDINSNEIGIKPIAINERRPNKLTIPTAKDSQFDTYPKTSPVNEQKPLRRANTDTDKIQSVSFLKDFGEKSTESRKSSKSSSKSSRTTSPARRASIEDRKISQGLSIKSSEPPSPRQMSRKISVESKATSPIRSPKTDVCMSKEFCTCGCGNAKGLCKNTCSELQKGQESSRKQSLNTETDVSSNGRRSSEDDKQIKTGKQIETQTDFTLAHGEYAQSSSTKKDTQSGPSHESKTDTICSQRTKSKSNNNSLDRENYTKHCSIQTGNESEKCSCGCGGPKDICQKSCKQRQNDMIINVAQTSTHDKDNVKGEEPSKTMDIIRKEVGIQKYPDTPPMSSRSTKSTPRSMKSSSSHSENVKKYEKPLKVVDSNGEKSSKREKSESEVSSGPDPIIDLIQNITKKYTKKDVDKNRKKKCFKEIITVLNYLLDTDDNENGNTETRNRCVSSTSYDTESYDKKPRDKSPEKVKKRFVDKAVQLSSSKPQSNIQAESSEVLTTDIPHTSSDSATCKVLNKIKKECEKYHQKRCKIHNKNCDSTNSSNCEKCKRYHQCQCRNHRCKNNKKTNDKAQKTPVAYNLILQTSESLLSDAPSSARNEKARQLKNIIVKVPKKKLPECMPFKEIAAKFEKKMDQEVKTGRSRSLPNESDISSMEEIIRRSQGATVREYLERNRPDFIEKCNERQTCMRYISETRATQRAQKRDVLSVHLSQVPDVTQLEADDLQHLARELARYMRQKQPAPKFINERQMKKHSEKIYKSLPEVVRKKEEIKKENIKRTNLLMANIFKRNLQKKTLQGAVNISNYSTVIKI